MAATTAILLAATSAVGLYGAQAEQAKQLSKDLEGASPLVKSTIANLTTENVTLKAENKSLETEKAILAKEKSDALAKLVAEERSRQSMTQKLVANSPAEEAFRKANGQILGKAAETIISTTNPSERVAEVLRSPASNLFRRGTIQQLFQRVLIAEGMTEAQAAAAAAPVPVEAPAEEADGGAPAPVPVPEVAPPPEEADGGAPAPVVAPEVAPAPATDVAAAAVLSPANKALVRAVQDAEEALDEVVAAARRSSVPGTNVNLREDVISAREAVRRANEAVNNALGTPAMGPPTSGLGEPMRGGAKVAGSYDDFAQLWLDGISRALSGVAGEKETKTTKKAQSKLDAAAALAATAFQTSITRIIERVKRDRVSKDAAELTPEKTAEVLPKKQALDDVLERATAAAAEATAIQTDDAWTAFSSKLSLKDELPAAYAAYAAAINASVVKKPLSERLGLSKFTSRPAVVAPVVAPAVEPEPAPVPVRTEPTGKTLEEEKADLDALLQRQFRLDDIISKAKAENKEASPTQMRMYVMLDRIIKAKRERIKSQYGVDPDQDLLREDTRTQQEEALNAEPMRKPGVTPRKRLGGLRKRTLKRRRGLNKRKNV